MDDCMSELESGMVSMRWRGTPRVKRCFARKGELVSVVWAGCGVWGISGQLPSLVEGGWGAREQFTLPLSTSSPMIRQAADWYNRPLWGSEVALGFMEPLGQWKLGNMLGLGEGRIACACSQTTMRVGTRERWENILKLEGVTRLSTIWWNCIGRYVQCMQNAV